MAGPIYVYGLRADAGGQIRYVGRALDPVQRLHGHCNRGAAGAVRKWIASLDARPEIVILQECATEPDAQIAERFWIAKLRNEGVKLLNASFGGENARHRSGKSRRRWPGFGQRVVSARERLGMNQYQLSKLVGMSQGSLSRIEKQERDYVSAETAVRLARVLDVDVDWLVTGEDKAAQGAA